LKGYITAKVSIKSQKFYAPKFLIQAQQKFGRLPKLGILRHVHPSGTGSEHLKLSDQISNQRLSVADSAKIFFGGKKRPNVSKIYQKMRIFDITEELIQIRFKICSCRVVYKVVSSPPATEATIYGS
jgi:hypothetical protein